MKIDYSNMVINEDISILESMKQLDEAATKMLFVEKNKQIVAALSDGDIRRWILSGGSLEAEISNAANYNLIFLYENERENAHFLMKQRSIDAIPILSKDKELIDVVFLHEKSRIITNTKIKNPVVIMAGGEGKRLYPYTKILPKALVPIGETPIIERIINEFHTQGAMNFHLILNHKKNMIKAYFNDLKTEYKVNYVEETIPLGTGGGLSLLKDKVNETFILTNCDILIHEEYGKIIKHHEEAGNIVTMVCSLKNYKIPYGVVEFEEEGKIKEIKEKPNLSFFTNTGCYIVNVKVIEELIENERIDFPSILEAYIQKGEKIGVYPIGENAWLDMGEMDELDKMQQVFDGMK